jgi:hypothetical protein
MSINAETFHKIKCYLWECPADFWVVYTKMEREAKTKLKFHLAASSTSPTRQGCERLAAKYLALATICFRHRRNRMLSEFTILETLQSFHWFGLVKPKANTSVNSFGRRWWHLVICSGAVGDAGYTIVTRVAAKDRKELRKYIADVQTIVRQDKGDRHD